MADPPQRPHDRPNVTSDDPANWYQGNALRDGADARGWFVGHFLPPSAGLRRTEDVEVKWFRHRAGETRADLVKSERRTTVSILISGRFRVELGSAVVLLERPGDYVLWGPGVDHTWTAETDSTVVTVRWPSIPAEARGG
jgi:hypothetical protein